PTEAVSEALDRAQFLARVGQNAAAGRSHLDGVFDPDSSEAFQVYAWFDRHGHPGFELAFISFADTRRLMNLQTQAVSGRVHKRLAETITGSYTPRLAIHMRCRDAGLYSIDCSQLRLQHGLIGALHFRGGRAEEQHARHVAGVSVLERTHVDHYQAAGLQPRRRGLRMR